MLLAYYHEYVRSLFPPSTVKQKFVMNVIFDSMALRYVYRLGRSRLEKASWDSLLEETWEKM